MANDTDRPLPTQIFDNETTITLGNATLQLAYGGPYHQNGNIFIYAPQHKILMAVDQFSQEEHLEASCSHTTCLFLHSII